MSTKARIAVAAGLIALVVFAAGAVWLRLGIGEMYDGYEKTKAAGGEAYEAALEAAGRAGKPLPDVIQGPIAGEALSLAKVDWFLWPGVVVAAALVGFVAWASAAGALRPVEWMRWQAAEITAGTLDRRIDVPVRKLGIGRLSIALRAALAAALIASGPLVGGVVWLRDTVNDLYDARVGAEANAALQAYDALSVALTFGEPASVVNRYTDVFLYEVVHSDGRVESSDRMAAAEEANGGPFLPKPRPTTTVDWHRYATYDVDEATSARLRVLLPEFVDPAGVWSREVPTGSGGSAAIYVFEIRAFPENPAAATDDLLIPGVLAAVVLIGFVAWFATTRSLRPVGRIREQASEIGSQAGESRVSQPPTRDAVARLATTLNEMLDRLESSAKAQRQFIADAAHELRSPISGLRTVLEVAADHPGQADWPAVVGDAVLDTQRLQDLTEDLLLLARLDSALPSSGGQVDLAEVAAAYGARAEVRCDGPAPVMGEAKQLDRLLRNLVDNATRHAVSRVTVTTRSTEDTAVLEVADDGPGIPEADRIRVFDRFTRLDESRDSDAGGAGLGLAIAREIAVRHGGTLVAGDHAVFTATFPRARESGKGEDGSSAGKTCQK
ncbi:sensor histidine kinase [Amycolatopsis pittospori]|uniref:sensor histidine kinase n=1 Tax=Amycolatopsis pittospori TaxID=2749434 RepID=UPI0015F039A7|nr:HAMP domain-containing sensor histidine kinase [Amycolatopsis pittospori]